MIPAFLDKLGPDPGPVAVSQAYHQEAKLQQMQEKVQKKQMETPSKVLINNEIHVGETYEFIKGKYKGKTGVVQSVGPKTCKLKVGKELTGNINFDSLVRTKMVMAKKSASKKKSVSITHVRGFCIASPIELDHTEDDCIIQSSVRTLQQRGGCAGRRPIFWSLWMSCLWADNHS